MQARGKNGVASGVRDGAETKDQPGSAAVAQVARERQRPGGYGVVGRVQQDRHTRRCGDVTATGAEQSGGPQDQQRRRDVAQFEAGYGYGDPAETGLLEPAQLQLRRPRTGVCPIARRASRAARVIEIAARTPGTMDSKIAYRKPTSPTSSDANTGPRMAPALSPARSIPNARPYVFLVTRLVSSYTRSRALTAFRLGRGLRSGSI